MICLKCGEECKSNEKKCHSCGYEFFSDKDLNIADGKKKINRTSLIIVIIAVAIIGIILSMVLINNNNILKSKDDIVKYHCPNESYIENVDLSDVLSSFNCSAYASYLIDNGADALTKTHLETLMSMHNPKVYSIYEEVTSTKFNEAYNDSIYDYVYYDYLNSTKSFSRVSSSSYNSLISYALSNKDMNLFKSLLAANNTQQRKYSITSEYIAETYAQNDKEYIYDGVINSIKEKREYIDVYLDSLNDKEALPILILYDEEYYNRFKDDSRMNRLSTSFASLLAFMSLDELNSYITYGKTYDEQLHDDIISYYLLGNITSDDNYHEKLKIVIDQFKKSGYDVTYSNDLDRFMSKYSLTMMGNKNTDYSNIYNILINNGYKCYSSCSYTKYYR